MLKLLLFCKGQEHLKANTHRKMAVECYSSIHKGWCSLLTFQDTCQILHLPASHPPQHPSSSPQPHIYCPSYVGQTWQAFFQVQCWPHHRYTQHKYSYFMMYQWEFGSTLKWNYCFRATATRAEEEHQSRVAVTSLYSPTPSTAAMLTNTVPCFWTRNTRMNSDTPHYSDKAIKIIQFNLLHTACKNSHLRRARVTLFLGEQINLGSMRFACLSNCS